MQTSRPYLLRGGLDLVTPAVAMPPGHCISALNYESVMEGYGRVGGYERLDGRPKPHLAGYWTLRFDEGITEPSAGDTVTGPDGSAILLDDVTLDGGMWGASECLWGAEPMLWGAEPIWWGIPAYGALALAEYTGTIADDDDLTFARADGVPLVSGALTAEEDTALRRLAVELRRADIEAAPGTGPVRGVAWFDNKAWAIRDSGPNGILYHSSPTGWTAVTPNPTVAFTLGTARFTPGETLTRGGATATIVREVTTGIGSYAGGDATGYLVLKDVVGTFTAGVATSAAGSATIAGAPATTALPEGGRYDFAIHNFRGTEQCLYFAGGVGPAHEYSPTGGLSPINAPADAGFPKHVEHFQNHLFLGYEGGVLFSGIGEPFDFRTTAGAGDLGFGAGVTGFSADSSSLVITGDSRISYVTGTSAVDFQLVELATDSGAREWSLRTVGQPIFMDAIGIRSLTAADTFGGWRRGTMTGLVEPLFRLRRPEAVASVLVRSKDQYRVFWAAGEGLTLYVGRDAPESMPFKLEMVPFCAESGLDFDGNETILIGAEDGFVYQSDVGTSFDGEPIEALIRTAYNSLGSPYINKRFHSGRLEVVAGGDVELSTVAEYGYGNPEFPVGTERMVDLSSGGGLWDVAEWDQFYWSAREKGLAHFRLRGFGPNISIAILSRTATEQPHILSSLILNTTMRGTIR